MTTRGIENKAFRVYFGRIAQIGVRTRFLDPTRLPPARLHIWVVTLPVSSCFNTARQFGGEPMFPVLLYQAMLKPARLKTETTFTAEDPWNQNQRAQFFVDAYVMALKGTKPRPRPEAKPPLVGSFFYGIRSEIDGQERMLPESLTYLWRNNRVPLEALPRLLKEMQPSLRKTDFRMQVLTKMHTVLEYLCAGALGLGALGMVLGVVLGEEPLGLALGFGVMLGLMFGFVYLMLMRPRARRRKQMEWALARV
jgi:hypothetical protein